MSDCLLGDKRFGRGFVFGQHPLQLSGESRAKARARHELELALGERLVASRRSRIAQRCRQTGDLDWAADELADQVDRLDQLDGRSAADVVHGARVPKASRRDRPFDDVVDEGEVADLMAIAVDGHGRARERAVKEAPERHVWPLARAVGSEVAEADDGDAEAAVVYASELLG